MPPKIKIFEALGTLGDGNRIVIDGKEAKIFSSNRKKFYTVVYDQNSNAIMANDNGSYWQGYLGYPGIAYLLYKGILQYKENSPLALKDIPWKKINTKYKNNYNKTIQEIEEIVNERGFNFNKIEDDVDDIGSQINELQIDKLGKRMFPPKD